MIDGGLNGVTIPHALFPVINGDYTGGGRGVDIRGFGIRIDGDVSVQAWCRCVVLRVK